MSDALQVASTSLADLDPSVACAQERSRAARRRPPDASGQLESVLALDDLGDDTPIARRADVHAVIERQPAEERFSLTLADRRITMPEAMRPAVERLLGEPVVTIGSLPGLDPESRLVLVRRLVREMVIRRC